MKSIIFLMLLLSSTVTLLAQTAVGPSPIKWYDLETAEKLAKDNPKPLFIDMYTDWCGWCDHMMKTTFANEYIASYINTYYYPVRFNAEGFDTVTWRGTTYYNFPAEGRKTTHELAKLLMDGRMSYPTIVYIDLEGNKFPVPGYQDIRKQEPLMYYFAENIHKSVVFDEFEKLFWYTYPNAYTKQIGELTPEQQFDTTGVVKWYTLQEAFELSKTKPRKIWVEIYVQNNVSSNITNRTSYRNKHIAKYLNENYYPVRFDALDKKEYQVMGMALKNPGVNHPFHDFTVNFAVNGNRIYFPTYLVFDEKGQPINRLQEFLPPKGIEMILDYFGTDAYKTLQFPDFQQKFVSKL